jgi:cystathionine gamma-synthase
MMPKRDARTVAAVNGIATDKSNGAVTPPIYLSSNFVFPDFEVHPQFDYTRTANPTRELLADTLAQLEGGAGAVVTSTGMSAINLILDQVKPGQRIVAPHDCYGGVYRLLAARQERKHFEVDFIDQGNLALVVQALSSPTALVLVETPSNPLMRVYDIATIAQMAKKAGAFVAVDNTFLSPALQRPISLGADYVYHSTTKYLNGHSDVVGGAVVAAEIEQVDALKAWANVTGVTGAPFDSYMTLRGIRSLFPRIERQQETATAIAQFLVDQPQVAAVHYPGLSSHPNHELAQRQQDGFGAMLSVELHGGIQSVREFTSAIRLFTVAGSLGGVESLVAHPATMTHSGMGAEARKAAGIGDALLRLSVGLEAERDLVADLKAALGAIGAAD